MAVLSSCLFSCKKDKDENAPAVSILIPSGPTTVNVFDTLIVQAQIRDENRLEWARFSIINENNSTVLPTITHSLGGVQNELITKGIPIDDIHLPSGSYFLRVTAFDGTNESSAFRELTIFEAPLEILKVFTITPGGSVSIDSLQTENFVNATTVSSDFGEAIANPYDRQLVIMGSENSGINFLEGESLNPMSTQGMPPSDGDPFYLDLHWDGDDHRIYVARRDGQLDIFKAPGILSQSIDIAPNLRPHLIQTSEEYVYVLQKNFAETQFSLGVYFKSSGQFFQSVDLSFDPVSMKEHEGGLLLFDGSSDEFSYYEPSGNFIDYTLNLNLGSDLLKTLRIGQTNGFVFLTDDGVFFNFDLFNGAPQSLGFADAKDIDYDEVDGALFVLGEGEVRRSDLQGNVTDTFSADSEAEQVILMYNK